MSRIKEQAKKRAMMWAAGAGLSFMLSGWGLVLVLVMGMVILVGGGGLTTVNSANACAPDTSSSASTKPASSGAGVGLESIPDAGKGDPGGNGEIGLTNDGQKWTLPKPGPPMDGPDSQAKPGMIAGPIPADFLAIYQSVASDFGIPWTILASVGWQEMKHGKATGHGGAGAQGPMQFLPATWAAYGMDGDGDGAADINNPADAIAGAANYLVHSGLKNGDDQSVHDAIWNYNHSDAYVNDILIWAWQYADGTAPVSADAAAAPEGTSGDDDDVTGTASDGCCPVPADSQGSVSEVAVTGTVTGAAVPVPGAVLTSGYGPRWGSMHSGLDFAAPAGTPIYAVADGVVILAGPASGFGHAIAIQHGDGMISVYGHEYADGILVTVGQQVTAGQQIGLVGSDGQSTGPHLHFEINQPLWGNRPNPTSWLQARGIQVPAEGGTWPGTPESAQPGSSVPSADECTAPSGAAQSTDGVSSSPETVPAGVAFKLDWSAEQASSPDPTVAGAQITPRMAAVVQALQDAGLTWNSVSCWDPHAQNPQSDHPQGRACDFMLDPNDSTQVGEGWKISSFLIKNQPTLGVKYLIFQGKFWQASGSSGAWSDYESATYGCPNPQNVTGCHYDHVHVSVY